MTKQEWLRQEIDKLCFELLEEPSEYKRYFTVFNKYQDKFIISLAHMSITICDKNDYVANVPIEDLKKLIAIAEQYKEME